MLDVLQKGYAGVIGSRLKGKREKGAMSRLNVLGNHLLTLMANVLYWTRISDVNTGCWGFRGEVISSIQLLSDGFDFEAELFTQVAKNRYPLAEVPIYYRRRETPPKLSSLKDGIKIGRRLLAGRFQSL